MEAACRSGGTDPHRTAPCIMSQVYSNRSTPGAPDSFWMNREFLFSAGLFTGSPLKPCLQVRTISHLSPSSAVTSHLCICGHFSLVFMWSQMG